MYDSNAKLAVKENRQRRNTSQPLMPQQRNGNPTSQYTLYPSFALGAGKIFTGYHTLAQWIAQHKQVVIDGFSGVDWPDVQEGLQSAFDQTGHSVQFIDTAALLKSEAAIQQLVQPFIGTPGSVWGTRCTRSLIDFFDRDKLQTCRPAKVGAIQIAIGTGAALLNWQAPVVYIDVPKNEIQFRMRAGAITNLGASEPAKAAEMYKRFYFVDWVVLSEHKKNIAGSVTILADAQWPGTCSWMQADEGRKALQQISENVFRVRPWFEAGAWGGQWMKEHLPGLNPDEVNYAWSFELIVPENGLVLESDGNLLELSFDFLMFREHKAVLGKHASVFGYEFPIRFDFLDTWEGGNLSIQCHPSVPYIREQFGETFTQDETYYILDCKNDATVYLGFQENIDPEAFRKALVSSNDNSLEIAITDYVQCHQAKKHELYLIPNGTIHSAGKNNLVLEISATPYIFTFKMYDWLRLDLNGQPRPINIEHAFKNLRFERKGNYVTEKLIAHPVTLDKGDDYELLHLPTHAEHFYDVHRIEFDNSFTIATGNVCHVLMLVEGSSVNVTTANGKTTTFQYAETFVVPAAASEYTLVNNGKGRAKVVKAFVKEDVTHL